MHACDSVHQTHELLCLDMWTCVHTFESSQLKGFYVGDLLYTIFSGNGLLETIFLWLPVFLPGPTPSLFQAPSFPFPSSVLLAPLTASLTSSLAHVYERGKPLEAAWGSEKTLTRISPDAATCAAVILLGHGDFPPEGRGRKGVGRYQLYEGSEMYRVRTQTQGSRKLGSEGNSPIFFLRVGQNKPIGRANSKQGWQG